MGRKIGKRERREWSRQYRERRRELRREVEELQQQYHERLHEAAHFGADARESRYRYRYYRRHIHYARPIAIVFSLLFWIVVLALGGFPLGFRLVLGVLAALSTIGGIMELTFLLRMDKRVLVPLDNLEEAARKIANGDYDVRVEGPFHPETAALVRTFNEMAKALKESAALKHQYEENRKDLIANISHDLKTPITSILGYVDAILEIGGDDKDRTERYLSIIKSNSLYMNKLIDDLFLFSRLDMNRFGLNLERVNVRAFLRDLMEEFALDFGERGLGFEYRDGFSETELFADLDPKLFNRIARNILDNARKYGPETGLRVEVESGLIETTTGEEGEAPSGTQKNEATPHEGAARFFFVSIADNGHGLPEETLERLFERFFRADPERTKNVVSSGLGLAIARELTEAHGGCISAKNRVEGGLVFTIELPLAARETPPSGGENQASGEKQS